MAAFNLIQCRSDAGVSQQQQERVSAPQTLWIWLCGGSKRHVDNYLLRSFVICARLTSPKRVSQAEEDERIQLLRNSHRMKSSVFWDVALCSPLKMNPTFRRKVLPQSSGPGFLAWLILRPWGGYIFLLNVGLFSTDYTAFYLRR
jgi:hypothetical protein